MNRDNPIARLFDWIEQPSPAVAMLERNAERIRDQERALNERPKP